MFALRIVNKYNRVKEKKKKIKKRVLSPTLLTLRRQIRWMNSNRHLFKSDY